MNDAQKISRRGVLARHFKRGKYWYIEQQPMGTRTELGPDGGVYDELSAPPTETNNLRKTGRQISWNPRTNEWFEFHRWLRGQQRL